MWDVAVEMEPEDGKLWIYGEQERVAFTERGMENLRELIADRKRRGLPSAAVLSGWLGSSVVERQLPKL